MRWCSWGARGGLSQQDSRLPVSLVAKRSRLIVTWAAWAGACAPTGGLSIGSLPSLGQPNFESNVSNVRPPVPRYGGRLFGSSDPDLIAGRQPSFFCLFITSHIGKLTHPRGAVPRFLSLRRFRETDRRLITTGARNELVSAPSMKRFCGAARAAPLATRALALRAFTGRTLSTVPAKPVRLDPQLESVLARFRARGGPNEKEGAARLVEDFERLQTRKVMRVLLVCSDYDSYTFEEDGLLTELVDAEYSDNHLSKPPTIERVSSPEKAISRVRENPSSFDLIITLLRNEGHNTNAASFVSSIQQEPLPRPRPRPSPDPRPDTRPTLRPDTHPSTHLSPRLSPSQSPNPNTHPHPHRTPPRPQPTRTPTLRSSTARCRTATPTPSPTPTPILTPTPTLSCAAQQRATRLAACFEPV